MASPPRAGDARRRAVLTRRTFTRVVFGALLLGALVELVRSPPPLERFRTPPEVAFEPLVAAGEGDAAVFGRILDEAGEGAEDVVVECLVRGRPRWTTTGPAGAFRLADLPAGRHEFLLLAIGRPPTRVEAELPRPGAVLWELDPPLEPLRPVPPMERSPFAGTLLASPGSEVGACSVVLLPAEGGDPLPDPLPDPLSGALRRRAPVAADGAFRIDDLVHGRYELRVLPGWAPGGTWPVLAEATVDHPAASPPSVALASGRLDVVLRDAAGEPVTGALVHAAPADAPGRPWPPAVTDGAGRASIADLPAGDYRVEILRGSERRAESVRVEARSVRLFEPAPEG